MQINNFAENKFLSDKSHNKPCQWRYLYFDFKVCYLALNVDLGVSFRDCSLSCPIYLLCTDNIM